MGTLGPVVVVERGVLVITVAGSVAEGPIAEASVVGRGWIGGVAVLVVGCAVVVVVVVVSVGAEGWIPSADGLCAVTPDSCIGSIS